MTAVLQPYQRVVAATGLSNLADGIRFVALPLLALEVTSSPLLLSSVIAASLAPGLLFSLWAGGITDRADRRQLARRTALFRMGLLLLLAVLIVVGVVPIALLLIASFVLGLSEVLADNVNGALIPALVAESDLERANSRVVGAEILGNEFAGPALGGLLFAAAAALPFFTNAGLLALAFLLLSGLPLIPARSTSDADVHRPRARDGVTSVWSSPLLRTITWSSALLAAIDGAWFALLAWFIRFDLGMSPAALGVFLAVGALGGLLGAAAADRSPDLALHTVSAATFASMTIALAALAAFPNTVVVAIALVVTSGAFSLWNIFMVSARQRASTPQALGRIGAAYRTIVVASALLGTLLGGLLAELFSIRATLAAAAIALGVAGPLVSRSLLGQPQAETSS